jgi:tellurite methyltransferase
MDLKIKEKLNTETNYWNNYYKKHNTPCGPSLFAQFVYQNYLKHGKLLELGCGNGRDSIYFAQNKDLHIKAIDQADKQIAFLQTNYSRDNLHFFTADFTNLKDCSDLSYIYSRFTMHSIPEQDEKRILEWSYKNLKKDGYLLIESRSIHDPLYNTGGKVPGENHAFITDHYRRFVKFEHLQTKLKHLNFKVVYAEENTGFAPYEDTDPIIIRIIAQKNVQG